MTALAWARVGDEPQFGKRRMDFLLDPKLRRPIAIDKIRFVYSMDGIVMASERDDFYFGLEKAGPDQVRKRLTNGEFGGVGSVRRASVESWLVSREKSLSAAKQRKLSLAPIIISTIALIVSILSYFEARTARNLNYLTNLPALTARVELVHPMKAGKPIEFNVKIKNNGRSVAKKLEPELRFKFLSAPFRFIPDYSDVDSFGKSKPPPTTSELTPGEETTLVGDVVRLQHDHDVEAVTSGRVILYIYGPVPYLDIDDKQWEFHFCGYYRHMELAKAGHPLKLTYCQFYNETIQGHQRS